MKKLLVREKLSFQLIVAIAISLFVSMGAFFVLERNLTIYSMNNEGNVEYFFSYMTFSITFIVPIIIFIITFLLLIRKKVRYIKYISEQVNKVTNYISLYLIINICRIA